MLGEVRHRHDIDFGLMHEACRTGGRQRHRMNGVDRSPTAIIASAPQFLLNCNNLSAEAIIVVGTL
jgi:hypothetical protein